MKNFFKNLFSTSNEINENLIVGIIVLIYIMIIFAFKLLDRGLLISWLAFDTAFFGIGAVKAIKANGV